MTYLLHGREPYDIECLVDVVNVSKVCLVLGVEPFLLAILE